MASFTISSAGTDQVLNADGQVTNSTGDSVGTWTTNAQNQLVIQPTTEADGTVPPAETIDVKWKFNENNQLCVLDQSDVELFNFNTTDNIPDYELREARLRVQPDDTNEKFMFFIMGDWALNDQHQLEFTVGTETSVIDGFFSDTKSRLTYHFTDSDQPWIANRLIFAGRWDIKNNDGTATTKFFYKIADGTEKCFDLPGKMIVQKGTNQFRYTYDKDGGTFGITLLGFLKISENFEITYTIDQYEAQEGAELVKRTSFSLNAAFHGDRFDGDLNMVLVKDDASPGDYNLAVTGAYKGMIGDAHVMAGFQFSQRRKGRIKTTTFGFGGEIKWENGQFVYQLNVNDKKVVLHMGAEIMTSGGAVINADTTVVGENGNLKKVTFLLGVSF